MRALRFAAHRFVPGIREQLGLSLAANELRRAYLMMREMSGFASSVRSGSPKVSAVPVRRALVLSAPTGSGATPACPSKKS